MKKPFKFLVWWMITSALWVGFSATTSQLAAATAMCKVIAPNGLYFRPGPAIDPPIALLPKTTQVTPRGATKDRLWVQALWQNKTGWLKADPFGTELRLTTDGRRKVEGRLAGEPKAQAVTAPQVLEALQVISGALREEPLDSFRLQITQPDRLTDAPRTPEIETASVEVTPTDERLLQAIWTRRGQADFRAKLLLAYGGRCAITDCGAEEALEAAHVFPFAEDRNYELSNGILMRADMHTLFDLFLLSIEPKTTAVWLAPGLLPHYGELHSRIVKFPKDPSLRPDAARLEHHFEQWKIRWQPAKS